MTWDDLFGAWSAARRQPGAAAHMCLQAARKRVVQNTLNDWAWLEQSLSDPDRKWFVAAVFAKQPVAMRLFGPMLRAGVLERNPSLNRQFIEPCVQSFGAGRVLEQLLQYLETGTSAEKAGAASALYWVNGNPRNEDLDQLRQCLACQLLREFVANEDLQVRQRILPMLRLEPAAYPAGLAPLTVRAVEIARGHPDEYLRHRVEIQLGRSGPLLPIPDTVEPCAGPTTEDSERVAEDG